MIKILWKELSKLDDWTFQFDHELLTPDEDKRDQIIFFIQTF